MSSCNPSKTKVVGARVSIVVSVVLLASSIIAGGIKAAEKQTSYNVTESKNKLITIGQSLSMYRNAHGFKPTSEWNLPTDAGLPENILDLAKPGHVWSLVGGEEAFKLAGVIIPGMGAMDFQHAYPFKGLPIGENSPYASLGAIMKAQGTRMPVLIDPHFGMQAKYSKEAKYTAMVLRMDGTVDVVSYNPADVLDVLRQ